MSILTNPTKTERPHRRLSLTRPTLPAANVADVSSPAPPAEPVGSTPEAAPTAVTPSVKKKRETKEVPIKNKAPADSATPVVRVMAYLSESEAALLDDLWMQYRRSPQKPSKSDILRAALTLASARPNDLTAMLSQQQTNTLSRQRVSKIKNSSG